MNKSNILALAVGAIIGSAATWYYLKTKYENYIQEEIESLREYYGEKHKDETPKEEVKREEQAVEQKKSMMEYAEELVKNRYTPQQEFAQALEDERITFPRVITPEEFTEYDDYYVASLTYFQADNILCDDEGRILEIDETIGVESLDHFGEYEDDCVHVRNNELRTDYEVLLDLRKYSEVYDKFK